MGSGAMIYIPDFVKISSAIQELVWEIYRHPDSMEISLAIFNFFKIRKVG
jgi:hypothetical protein